MKRILNVIVIFVCISVLFACDSHKAHFTGKVLEKYENSCLIEVTNNGNQSLKAGDIIVVSNNIDNCPDYSVGDFLKITFNGEMADSYPPQIIKVYSIEKTDSSGNSL